MDQKHAVEDVLLGAGLPGLMLEATMFMEEFWKKYTRPGLLKGSFTFSLPGEAAQRHRAQHSSCWKSNKQDAVLQGWPCAA
jgi:hypothetical protein